MFFLLNIKSLCVYKSLRDQKFVPLPFTNTVKQYSSIVSYENK